jgi:hypothetical protein
VLADPIQAPAHLGLSGLVVRARNENNADQQAETRLQTVNSQLIQSIEQTDVAYR